MKKRIILLFIAGMLFMVLLAMGCAPQGGSSGGGGGGSKDKDDTAPIDYKAMVTVPAITNFEMGFTGILDATPVHTVPSIKSFYIGKYEVTFAYWKEVYDWAKLNGYTFSKDTPTTTTGVCGGEGTGSQNQPVTTVNWRDCIVWCNACTEYYNANNGTNPDLNFVYCTDAGFTIPLKTATGNTGINTTVGSEDNPYVNWEAKGYRLPTEAEWEAAARYQDGTIWLRGDAPSGWIDNNPADGNWRIEVGVDWEEDDAGDNYSEVNAVAWWYSNNNITTHIAGTRNANNLQIFDMSGNVTEWCWDWWGTYTTSSPYTDLDPKGHAYDAGNPYRILRGGSYNYTANYLQSSYRNGNQVYDDYFALGFRLVRIN